MKVLIAVASKHGATEQIAAEIAQTLRVRNLQVDQPSSLRRVASIEDYDAIVLGSALYAGRWLKAARDFAQKHEAHLLERPVWLFSSGPIGDPPKPMEEPQGIARLAKTTAARGHQLFPGRLDRKRLNCIEKMLASAFHAAEGDFRDWQGVRNWAHEIADALGANAARSDADPAAEDCPESASQTAPERELPSMRVLVRS